MKGLKAKGIKSLSPEDVKKITGGLIVDCSKMCKRLGPDHRIEGIDRYVIVDEMTGKVTGTAKILDANEIESDPYSPNSSETAARKGPMSAAARDYLRDNFAKGGSKFGDSFVWVGDDLYYKPLVDVKVEPKQKSTYIETSPFGY